MARQIFIVVLLLGVIITYAVAAPSILARTNIELPAAMDYDGLSTTEKNTLPILIGHTPRLVYLGSFGSKRYYTEYTKRNWVQAKNFCLNLAMKLVKVATTAERDYLYRVTPPNLLWTSEVDVGNSNQVHWSTDRSPITVPLYGGVMINTAVVLDGRTSVPDPGQVYTLKMDTQAYPLCEL